ncbi:MAG: ROK family protein [Sphaerochaetaceae bacterium]|nr:ROK family protein [Sphaerochaetaceae bacterium]
MKRKYKVILAIDSGGTYYKTALINLDGSLIEDTFIQMPSISTSSRLEVISQFKKVLATMNDIALKKNLEISRVCLGFPGPFDYIKCCSLMNHKFLSIKEIPLKPIIREVIPCDKIDFHYDLHASTMGAFLFDEAKGYSKIYCIGLGTGLGAGYLRDKKIISYNHGQPRYPIFQLEVGDKILEDYVSNRAIVNEYKKKVKYDGVLDAKKIEDFAKMGDENAIAVYRDMGEILGNSIKKLLKELEVDCVVFCGQISRGYKYFGPYFTKVVDDIPSLKKITPVKDFNSLALRGVCFLEEEQ